MIKSYVGPMFAGKSSILINKYNKIWNKESIICFKPKIDTRDEEVIKSRDYDTGLPAIGINDLSEIMNHITPKTKTILIDEVQFLSGDIQVLNYLSIIEDIEIIVCGLNMDANQIPFGIIPEILAISDEVEVIKAVCFDCNKEASFSYFEGELAEDGIVVGNAGYYPLCRSCLLKRSKGKTLTLEKKFSPNKIDN